MRSHTMLPYRRAALAVAAAYIASASAQEWGGGSQQYCSNQNTGSDYSAVNSVWNSYQSCTEECKSNYAFAVVQWQNCWCANYIPADQSDTGDCNQDCPGYPSNSCGNQDKGLYGYIALDKSPSGTAGSGSSSQASSTSAPTSTSERVSTSTSSTSSSPPSSSERTSFSSSVFSSSAPATSSSDPSSESPPPRTSSSSTLTSQSQTSSEEATSMTTTSSSSSSSSDPPITSSSSTSSTPPPPTSTSSSSSSSFSSPEPTSTTSSSMSETPSPVTSTRVVTISGEAVTQTVTSTPMVAPDLGEASETDSPSKISGGAIAGIVIGVLALLALLVLAAFLLWRRKKNNDQNNPHGYPEMASNGTSRPRRNVSVLSKVGLLARHSEPADDDPNDPSSAGAGAHSARHSALFAAGSSGSAEPSSPLGPQSSQHSNSLYQMDSRGHSKPLVYDQRLNPSALFANADANGSRISMADNTDYSRPLDGIGGGKLQVRNPDPRASFESRA